MCSSDLSISEKTDIAGLLFSTKKTEGGFTDEEGEKHDIAGYLIPLGIKYFITQMKKKSNSKSVKRLLVYSALAGVSAFVVYQFLNKREKDT